MIKLFDGICNIYYYSSSRSSVFAEVIEFAEKQKQLEEKQEAINALCDIIYPLEPKEIRYDIEHSTAVNSRNIDAHGLLSLMKMGLKWMDGEWEVFERIDHWVVKNNLNAKSLRGGKETSKHPANPYSYLINQNQNCSPFKVVK